MFINKKLVVNGLLKIIYLVLNLSCLLNIKITNYLINACVKRIFKAKFFFLIILYI